MNHFTIFNNGNGYPGNVECFEGEVGEGINLGGGEYLGVEDCDATSQYKKEIFFHVMI